MCAQPITGVKHKSVAQDTEQKHGKHFLKKFHLCLQSSQQCDAEELERSFETKAHSEKSMNVSDVKVTDEDGFSVSQQNNQSEQQDCDGANLDQSCRSARTSARCHKCETQRRVVEHGVERISLVRLPREACCDQGIS